MKYSSPFRESRNSQSQSTQQQYEQEFWKLKAQRLEAKNEELSKENQALIKKSIDSSKREQELIDRLASQSTLDRSRKKGDDKDKQSEGEAAREEIQRLGKEIRVLKNQHSMEMTKITEEGKRLKKRVSELQARQLSWVSGEEHSTKVKALNEEITTLTKRLAISEQQLEKLKEEKKKLLLDIEALSKEVVMFKSREKAALKQEEENLMDLRKYEKFMHEYKTQKQQQSAIQTTPQDAASIIPSDDGDNSEEMSRLRREVEVLEKQRESNRRLIFQLTSWEHDKTRTETKLKQMECELSDSKAQLQNVLAKLSPLLGHKSELKGKENIQAKASLTLLEIFLKKYKIQAF